MTKDNKIRELLLSVYLIFISVIPPLYMKEGYYRLGEAKGIVYMMISLSFLALFLVMGIIRLLKKKENEAGVHHVFKYLIFANAFSLIVSLIFAVDHKTAFFGILGWRMGFLTEISIIIFCYLFSKGALFDNYVYCGVLAVPFFACVLGILNRYGIDPFSMLGEDRSFLATLGNINWLTGYLSVFGPIGIGMVYISRRFTKKFFVWSIYLIVVQTALLTQGSDSAVLILTASYLMLLWISLRDRKKLQKFIILCGALGISGIVAEVMGWFFAYNYDRNILIELCRGHAGIILLAAAFFLYRVSRLLEEIKAQYREKIYKAVFLTFMGLSLACVIYYLATGFDDFFGNGRGIIWRMTIDMYSTLTPWQKVVGVGEDCYYSYIYTNPFWAESFLNVLDGNRLTNAHCELLTRLVQGGLIGAASFVGIFGYIIYKLVQAASIESNQTKKKQAAVVCLLPIVSYLANSFVSFAQVISTPYIYICIGLGVYALNGITPAQESE